MERQPGQGGRNAARPGIRVRTLDGKPRQLPRLQVWQKHRRRPRHEARRPAVRNPDGSRRGGVRRHPAGYRRPEHRFRTGAAALRPARRRDIGYGHDAGHDARQPDPARRPIHRGAVVRQTAVRQRRLRTLLQAGSGTYGRCAADARRRRGTDRPGRLPRRARKPARPHGDDPRIPVAAGQRIPARRPDPPPGPVAGENPRRRHR